MSHARLEAALIGVHQSAGQVAGLIGLDKSAAQRRAVISLRYPVGDPVVGGEGWREYRISHPERQCQVGTHLPCVCSVKFEVSPAAQCSVLTLELGVFKKRQTSEQQFGNRIARASAGRLDRVKPAAAVRLLVLDVVADEHTKFGGVGTYHLGEVVLPDEEVLMIRPRRLMPQRWVASVPPANSGKSCPLHARKDGWEHGSDLLVERITRRVCRNEDVIASA